MCEHNTLFISTKICARRAGQGPVRKAAALGCPCRGNCGKYHPVSVDTIRNDRVACLRAVGVTDFTSHALRGNSEVLTTRAGQVSMAISATEAERRAGHSTQTRDKYYEREPHPAWVAAYNRLQHELKLTLTVEEAQRLGSVIAEEHIGTGPYHAALL